MSQLDGKHDEQCLWRRLIKPTALPLIKLRMTSSALSQAEVL